MSNGNGRPGWDYNIGLVLAVLGGIILVSKLKILQFILNLWPLALIFLGWQMYKKADGEPRRRRAAPQPDLPDEDLD